MVFTRLKESLARGMIPMGLGVAVSVGVVFALYLPTRHYTFIFDDFPTILEYPHIHDSLGSFLFSSSRWIPRFLHKLGFFLSSFEPWGYRLVNLVLLLGIVLLTYRILENVLARFPFPWWQKHASWIALFTAFLMVAHPAQTQTATYITQMSSEGVALFFVLLVTYFFTRTIFASSRYTKFFWYGATLFGGYIACGTKEIIVVLPVLLLIFDFFLLAAGRWGLLFRRVPMHIGLAVIMCVGLGHVGKPFQRVVYEAQSVEARGNRGNLVAENYVEKIGASSYRLTQPRVLAHYLALFFFPMALVLIMIFHLSRQPFLRQLLFQFCCYFFL